MKTRKRRFVRSVLRGRIRVGRYLASRGVQEYTILSLFSVVMGAAAGLAAVTFHHCIDFVAGITFPYHGKMPLFDPGLAILAVPVAGMLIQHFMTRVDPHSASQRGVLDVIQSVALRNGRIPLRTTIFHFIAPAVSMGTGNTVGPEAPAAQTGAGVVAALGRLLGLSESRQRVFTAAGAGAAIAAVFNTPLGGIFFAVEVILLNELRAAALSALLLASVTASTVSRVMLGNEPAFGIEVLSLGPYHSFPFYLLLGLGAGVLSTAFIGGNDRVHGLFERLYQAGTPRWLGMGLVGLLMGGAILIEPGIFGGSYQAVNGLLAGEVAPQEALMLLVLKFILVMLILNAGGFGGIFAPSIFMGGCYGYLFAWAGGMLLDLPLDSATYTLVGMGAVLAGVNSIPLASIMILFEMTNDYHFILPLMLGVAGSTLVVQLVMGGSIYSRALERRGLRFAMGGETRVLRSLTVNDVMQQDVLSVPEGMPLSRLVQTCLERPHRTIYTTNADGEINGVISAGDLHQLITRFQSLQETIVAGDLADPSVAFLTPDQDLESALKLFGTRRVDELPVAERSGSRRTVGTLHFQEVISAYNRSVVKFNLADGLTGDVRSLEPDEVREVFPELSLAEAAVPESFIGKTVHGVRLRNRFGVELLMVVKAGDPFTGHSREVRRILPDKDYRFERGDRLAVFGSTDRVETFRDLRG